MTFMVWNDRLSVGVESLDQDHKKLLEILNRLYDSVTDGSCGDVIGGVLDELLEYTQSHFSKEESLLEKTKYKGIEAHESEHQTMIDWVTELRTRNGSGVACAPSLETVVNLKDWLFDHILGTDQRYVPHLKRRGIH
jgi:hemerythrin